MKLNFTFLTVLTMVISSLNAQTITVTTASQLQTALTNALAGQTIVLTASSYVLSSGFKAASGANGTATSPITIKSSVNSSLSTGSLSSNYALYLPNNDYWVIDGIKLTTSKKALILDNSNYNIIKNVTVDNIGEEGIHLRTFSCYNTVSNCHFDNTGQYTPGYGEGIYFGSAYSNWSTYTSGNPDKSDYNIAEYNTFGDNVIAENIDVKEGTTGGIIRENIFNGKGLNNDNYADSFIDLKGNSYIVECNTGSDAMTDGIQTHIVYTGWGNYNTFKNNNFDIGNTDGYSINVSTTSTSNGTATGNVVCTNNTYSNAKALTNITTTDCTATSCSTTLGTTENNSESAIQFSFYPNPVNDELIITSLKELNNAIVSIIDLTGKKVKQIDNINTKIMVIPKEKLAKGTYIVTISEANNIIISRKIIFN